jgi:hypothetical protein
MAVFGTLPIGTVAWHPRQETYQLPTNAGDKNKPTSRKTKIMSKTIATIGPNKWQTYKSTIIEEDDGRVHFNGDMDIDADGAYPFIVVPPAIVEGVVDVVLGCKARITDTRTGQLVDCVVVDTGPKTKTGEASIAAAKALGVPSSARTGGEEKPAFTYELWPGVPAVVNGVTYPLQHI